MKKTIYILLSILLLFTITVHAFDKLTTIFSNYNNKGMINIQNQEAIFKLQKRVAELENKS